MQHVEAKRRVQKLGLTLEGWCSDVQLFPLPLIIWRKEEGSWYNQRGFLKDMSSDLWLRKERERTDIFKDIENQASRSLLRRPAHLNF